MFLSVEGKGYLVSKDLFCNVVYIQSRSVVSLTAVHRYFIYILA